MAILSQTRFDKPNEDAPHRYTKYLIYNPLLQEIKRKKKTLINVCFIAGTRKSLRTTSQKSVRQRERNRKPPPPHYPINACCHRDVMRMECKWCLCLGNGSVLPRSLVSSFDRLMPMQMQLGRMRPFPASWIPKESKTGVVHWQGINRDGPFFMRARVRADCKARRQPVRPFVSFVIAGPARPNRTPLPKPAGPTDRNL